MRARLGERGFSVTEVTTILTMLAILAGVTAPAVSDYVEDAQLVRARADVRTLAVSLVRLVSDVGADGRSSRGWGAYDLLVGPGSIPPGVHEPSRPWTTPLDDEMVGRFDDHLSSNLAGYPSYDRLRAFGWRGAYVQQAVGVDPWGGRYAANVRAMRSERWDTVVLSAGPDGAIQSSFEIDGLPTAGDDIAALVASAGVPR